MSLLLLHVGPASASSIPVGAMLWPDSVAIFWPDGEYILWGV